MFLFRVNFNTCIFFSFFQYSTWSLMWLGWNIFVICLYLEVGVLNRVSVQWECEGKNWFIVFALLQDFIALWQKSNKTNVNCSPGTFVYLCIKMFCWMKEKKTQKKTPLLFKVLKMHKSVNLSFVDTEQRSLHFNHWYKEQELVAGAWNRM